MPLLVLIADMVASRASPDRKALQTQLQHVLARLNHDERVLSPYTITLGDEFQALPGSAEGIFGAALQIQAAVYPVRVRFSFAIGELRTDINPLQALGMDGPVFHAARAGIDLLKQQRGLYYISGLPAELADLANSSLGVLGHSIGKWKHHRLAIAASLVRGQKVQQIAAQLGISEQAVYKSISDGGVEQALQLMQQLSRAMGEALE
jgi:hypothetical protein